MENALSLENVSFSYGSSKVINNFSLEVEKGSFTTLLGASGSGKTTLLRLISGFLEPKNGTIKINGCTVNGISPEKRKIGMVFQDYALFPHMTVQQNLLYGIKIENMKLSGNSKKNKEEIFELLEKTSKSLGLNNLWNRFPSELSGGQQQRVALGRALVLEPSILLMDEPLSSLDTNLRRSVRSELKDIQQRLKITTVYVTHDQEEALSLSDKIAVLNDGKLVQQGTPRQIYFAPVDRFTAEFLGSANFINIHGDDYMIRPEWVKITANEERLEKVDMSDSTKMTGTILDSEFLGSKVRYRVETESGILLVDSGSAYLENFNSGKNVFLEFLFKKKL